LVEAYLAFQEDPKIVSHFALPGEDVARIEADLFDSLEAADLIVFE
jgi:hypothetical protein